MPEPTTTRLLHPVEPADNLQIVSNRDAIFLRLAKALQKLTEGASPAVGADCILHAKLAQALLREQGVETTIVVGEAAWRTGPGDSDVITHSPQISGFVFLPGRPLPLHVWLTTEQGDILDFTTHSLKVKAQLLDASDGGTTSVQWCPPYLLATPRRTTLNEVIKALDSGVFHYQEFPGLLKKLNEHGIGVKDADPSDLAVLRFLFKDPTVQVVGPNNVKQLLAEMARG